MYYGSLPSFALSGSSQHFFSYHKLLAHRRFLQVRVLKEERLVCEGAVEEARSREAEQRAKALQLKQDLALQRAQLQRHLTQASPTTLFTLAYAF